MFVCISKQYRTREYEQHWGKKKCIPVHNDEIRDPVFMPKPGKNQQ